MIGFCPYLLCLFGVLALQAIACGEGISYRIRNQTLHMIPAKGEGPQIAEIVSSPLNFDGKLLTVTLPPRTVSCIEMPRKQ